MKCLGKIACITLSVIALDSFAGVRGPTAHSRANCGNNESITWWLGHARDWRVVSFHNYDKDNAKAGYHYIDTGMGHTWRQAAVHWRESGPTGKYQVNGYHYFYERGHEILDVTTTAINCSIYDGWWDH